MRNIRIIAFGLWIVVLSACQSKNSFKIEGVVNHAGDTKKVYLFRADSLGQMIPVDSTFLNEDQKFTLKGVASLPEFYQLLIGQQSYMLIAENGNDIQFKTDLANQGANYELKGSDEADLITAYNKITSDFSLQTGALAEKYSKMITQNQADKANIIAQFNEKSKELSAPFLAKSYQFIQEHPKSLTSFFAANVMMGMDASAYETKLYEYSKTAVANFPKNNAVLSFAKQMEGSSKVAIGQAAPEIIGTSPEGKTLKLSDYKGKYVLLDFWASWCGPCREENPNVVKQYNLFKDKNFTVFSFSLDDDKEKWMKAINDDHLTWSHVSELKQFEAPTARLYNINQIPSSFLLNPQGIIIAKNLRGDALHQFLLKNLK